MADVVPFIGAVYEVDDPRLGVFRVRIRGLNPPGMAFGQVLSVLRESARHMLPGHTVHFDTGGCDRIDLVEPTPRLPAAAAIDVPSIHVTLTGQDATALRTIAARVLDSDNPGACAMVVIRLLHILASGADRPGCWEADIFERCFGTWCADQEPT